jgi:PAS domain S-box-containing protein
MHPAPPWFKPSLPGVHQLLYLWRSLVEPPPSIRDAEIRRLARLLSSLIIVVILLVIFSILVSLLGIPEDLDTQSLLPGLVVLVFAYALNRMGHYAPAAALTIGAMFLSVGYNAVATHRIDQLEYLLLAVLVSGVLFSPLFTVYIYLVSLVAIVAFSTIMPLALAPQSFEAFFLLGTVGILSIVVTFLRWHDLAQIERQARELAMSEARLANILRTASEVIITVDERQRIGFFNHSAEQTFAYTAAEVLGQPLHLLLPPRFRETHQRHTDNFAAAPEQSRRISERREIVGRRKDGSEFPMEAGISKLTGNGQTVFTFIGSDITERRRDEEARRRRLDEFAALYDTARDLAAQRELPSLLQTIVDRAISLLSAPSGYIYLYDVARSDLVVAVSRGLQLSSGTRLSLGEGMAGRVAQTLTPLIVNQYDTWEHRSAQFEGIPIKAVLGVPMLYAGELIGVLGVSEADRLTRQFTDGDAHLLSLFASQAAGAVHHTRRLEETRVRAEQLELLYEAGLTLNRVLDPEEQLRQLSQIAMRAVHADCAEFFRFDPATNELAFEFGAGYPSDVLATMRGKRFQVDSEQSLIGWVIRNRKPLNLPEVTADPRYIVLDPQIHSALWVPVEHEGRPRGVLAALSTRAHAFTVRDERLLMMFANQISIAMENTLLFEQTRQRLAELQAVNKVSKALRVAQTLDEMLPLLLDVTLGVMQSAQGAIWLYDPARDELRTAVTRGWGDETGGPPIAPEKPGEGINGYVFATGQPYVASDFHVDLRLPETVRRFIPPGQGGAVIPIRAGDNVIGTFDVNVTLPREITPGEIRLLTTLSEIAGNAIQRTMLHRQTERRLRYVQALHGIDTAIASSLDVRVTLSILLDHATSQLGVDAAAILLLKPAEQVLEFAAGQGFRTQALVRTRLRLGEGYAGRAALDRKTRVIPELSIADDFVRERGILPEAFVFYAGVPLLTKGEVKGVLEVFHRARLTPDDEWTESLEALASQAAIAIDNATLFDGLQRSNYELALAYDATIEGWSRALDLRDKETEGHSQRVTDLTLQLARAMGLSESELVHARRGALLHDIGKMGVPDSILLKPGPLSDEEWVIMRKHPLYAYDMLSPITFLRPALDIPYLHHEKWDGTGYPRGLKGEQIPPAARIFAVVDVWDALRSDRPYRPAWSEELAREHIASQAGTHFDPNVVSKFLGLLQLRT